MNHDPVEDLLRQSLDQEPVEDAGFTDAVMSSLPRRGRVRARWQRHVIVMASVVFAALAALLVPPVREAFLGLTTRALALQSVAMTATGLVILLVLVLPAALELSENP